jgi:hypothetical protein
MTNIAGAERLVQIFGRWPSFHDAEVVRYSAVRTTDYKSGPIIEADVHVFEMTSEVDARGFYVLRHHTLVTLRFDGVAENRMAYFNNQNALSELAIIDVPERQSEGIRYEVTFSGSFGIEASFLCRDAEVVAARPWNPELRAPAA